MRLLLSLPLLALAGCPAGLVPNPDLYDTEPVARMEAPQAAPVGRPVPLDGSASYDPDEDELVWSWRIDQAPQDSQLAVNPFSANDNRAAVVTSFVPDVLGRFTVALTVSASGLVSETAFSVIDVVPETTLPIADAGPDRAALEGLELCLSGEASQDPFGASLSYRWELAARPEASALTSSSLSDPSSAAPCFVPDAPGRFTLGLVVSASERDSAPDYVDVVVQSTNQPPLAAIDTLSAESCGFVQLDGTASSDPNGDPLSYQWGLLLVPPGSAIATGPLAFDDPSAAAPAFYADVAGEYVVELMVRDGEDYSPPAIASVWPTPKLSNAPPVLEHTPDTYFADGANPCAASCPPKDYELSTEGSWDPDADPLTFAWEVVSGNATLDSMTGPTAELTVTGPQGSCVFGAPNGELVTVRVHATDCSGATTSDEFSVLYECGIGL